MTRISAILRVATLRSRPIQVFTVNMSDTESDEELKKAIALSLAEQSPSSSKTKPVVVDLISSDEDDDLDAPVTARRIASTKALSNKKDGEHNEIPAAHTAKPAKTASSHGPPEAHIRPEMKPRSEGDGSLPVASTALPFLGLNRKQMEEERLLRAQQRKKPDEQAPTPEGDVRKRKALTPPLHASGLEARQVRAKLSESATASPYPPSEAASIALPILSSKDQDRALHAPGVQFPDGVVKKTWVYGCPRQDDIKIEEVLQKDDLDLAVLSAFQIDPDWIASKLHPTTKVVFVLQAKTEAEVRLLFL